MSETQMNATKPTVTEPTKIDMGADAMKRLSALLRIMLVMLAMEQNRLFTTVMMRGVVENRMWELWGFPNLATYLEKELTFGTFPGIDIVLFAIDLGYDHADNYRDPDCNVVRWAKELMSSSESSRKVTSAEALRFLQRRQAAPQRERAEAFLASGSSFFTTRE